MEKLTAFAAPALHERLSKEGTAQLERAAPVTEWPTAERCVLEGRVAEQLARFVNDRQASLVVVGSRGLGAVARVLLGSVSDRLVHICEQPVLLVH
jgi:nucleotide-binding universal stress UspA family protein